jgi:hypothetical protein
MTETNRTNRNEVISTPELAGVAQANLGVHALETHKVVSEAERKERLDAILTSGVKSIEDFDTVAAEAAKLKQGPDGKWRKAGKFISEGDAKKLMEAAEPHQYRADLAKMEEIDGILNETRAGRIPSGVKRDLNTARQMQAADIKAKTEKLKELSETLDERERKAATEEMKGLQEGSRRSRNKGRAIRFRAETKEELNRERVYDDERAMVSIEVGDKFRERTKEELGRRLASVQNRPHMERGVLIREIEAEFAARERAEVNEAIKDLNRRIKEKYSRSGEGVFASVKPEEVRSAEEKEREKRAFKDRVGVRPKVEDKPAEGGAKLEDIKRPEGISTQDWWRMTGAERRAMAQELSGQAETEFVETERNKFLAKAEEDFYMARAADLNNRLAKIPVRSKDVRQIIIDSYHEELAVYRKTVNDWFDAAIKKRGGGREGVEKLIEEARIEAEETTRREAEYNEERRGHEDVDPPEDGEAGGRYSHLRSLVSIVGMPKLFVGAVGRTYLDGRRTVRRETPSGDGRMARRLKSLGGDHFIVDLWKAGRDSAPERRAKSERLKRKAL